MMVNCTAGSNPALTEAKATLKNAELLKQFKQVEELPDDEQLTVIKFVGAYLRDFKAKQAYAS
jgi:hypothetical protein